MTRDLTGAHKIVVMGTSGSGKTTLGRDLAATPAKSGHSAEFLDADDFHTPQARAKMAQGIPLTDEDRAPWLARLVAELRQRDRVVLACSALRRRYRDTLREAGGVRFVFLDVPEALLQRRLQERRGHYAGTNLLASQLATLERPTPDETDVLTLEVGEQDTPQTLLERVLAGLGHER